MAKKIHRTMIGGQAVIEGVMMRGVDKTALAVRKPDGTINLDVWPTTSVKDSHSPLRIPIIRGVINFVEMLIFGYKTLMKSAEIAGIDLDEPAPAAGKSGQQSGEGSIVDETSPAADESEQQDGDVSIENETSPAAGSSGQQEDKGSIEDETLPLSDEQGDNGSVEADANKSEAVNTDAETVENTASQEQVNDAAKEETKSDGEGFSKTAMDAITIISLIAGFAFAIALFVIAPTLIVGKTDGFIHWGAFRTLAEGIIKIAIFIAYLALIARMKDIQRVYEYHGAEHKTIYCYEHGDELTPENARKYTRFHPRCGTSFLLIVLIVSIIVFSFVTWKTLWLRIVLKIVLLPLVVGISYEIIKFAGRHDNSFMRFILAPGLWLQRLTTREPDDSQLEVAIMSIKAVLTENPDDDQW
jgi:uncharacterized protein YqhQ